jgi:hypothetical protein
VVRTWGYNSYDIKPIVMPTESFGVCKNYKNCGEFEALLAWGYCTPCYDQRVERYANKNVGIVRKGMPEETLE